MPNTVDRECADTEVPGDSRICPSIYDQHTNSLNRSGSQFCKANAFSPGSRLGFSMSPVAITDATSCAPLGVAVFDIVLLRSDPKVIPPYASPNVAMMVHIQSAGDRSACNGIRKAVGANGAAFAESEISVSTGRPLTCPRPATCAADINMAPETCNVFQGERFNGTGHLSHDDPPIQGRCRLGRGQRHNRWLRPPPSISAASAMDNRE